MASESAWLKRPPELARPGMTGVEPPAQTYAHDCRQEVTAGAAEGRGTQRTDNMCK